jgi:hypothetical protein
MGAHSSGTGLGQIIRELIAKDAPMVEMALEYARAGFPVFPLKHEDDKAPLVSGGHHRAICDDALIIRKWWSQWAHAMPGIPMGPASGLWAIDLDRHDTIEPKKNCDGEAELRRMGFKIETIACRVRSASGKGIHLIFALPPGAMPRNRAGDIAPGVDTRGVAFLMGDGSNSDAHRAPGFEQNINTVSGGYIVAAGAMNVKGGRYVFEHGDYTTVEAAPRELLFLAVFNSHERRVIGTDPELRRRIDQARPQEWPFVFADRQRELKAVDKVRRVDADAAGYTAPLKNVTAYALRAFENEIREVRSAVEGARNHTLFKATCNLFELVKAGALQKDPVSKALTDVARATELDEKEIDATLSSAWKRVEARDLSKPRRSSKRTPCLASAEVEPVYHGRSGQHQ